MFIVDTDIKKGCENGKFIVTHYSEENVGAISYDLGIDEIITGTHGETSSVYELHPGSTVYIRTKEEIQIPRDYVGVVGEKNSVMREGLVVSAPYYQPGHRTYCFLRVQNISASVVTLRKGKKIAQIMFSKLSAEPCVAYSDNVNASFNNEVDYIGYGRYEQEFDKEIKEIEKKSDELDSKIQSIYSNVLVFMGIIAAIFSIITINFEAFKGQLDFKNILFVNLSLSFTVSFLMGLILTVTNKSFRRKRSLIPYWIIVGLLLALDFLTVFL